MDKLHLERMVFFGRHGVHPAERDLGARYSVDLELIADLSRAAASDRLEDTIDYAHVHELVRRVVEGPSRNLVESLADAIAESVLGVSGVQRVRVRVTKPPPLAGEFHAFTVELDRP